jgi:hypothetical protein
MWVFSSLAIVMIVGTAVCYFAMGYLPQMYIHLFAYGFMLAGIGYLIELMKKREQNMEAHIEWIMDKKFKSFAEELKTIRMMILKLEERRDYPEITTPPVVARKENNGIKEDRPIFSAEKPKQ